MKVTFPHKSEKPGAILLPYLHGKARYGVRVERGDIEQVEPSDDRHTLVYRRQTKDTCFAPLCLLCPLPIEVILEAWISVCRHPGLVIDLTQQGKPFVGDVQEVTVGDAVNKKPQFSEKQCDDIRRILTLIEKLKIARDAITTGDVWVNPMDAKKVEPFSTDSDDFSPPFKSQLRASLIDCLNAELNRLRESLPFEIQTTDDSNMDADET